MNRRSFLRGLIAVPAVFVAGKIMPPARQQFASGGIAPPGLALFGEHHPRGPFLAGLRVGDWITFPDPFGLGPSEPRTFKVTAISSSKKSITVETGRQT